MTRRHAVEYAALAIALCIAGWIVAHATFWFTVAIAFGMVGR